MTSINALRAILSASQGHTHPDTAVKRENPRGARPQGFRYHSLCYERMIGARLPVNA